LQRLGTLAYLNSNTDGNSAEGIGAAPATPATAVEENDDRPSATQYWEQAASLCQDHLGGLWALLLPHDPPGLWEQLQVRGGGAIAGRITAERRSS